MGAVAMIIVLAGMVIPIMLLLATVVFDVAVIGWAAYRLWHDRWSRKLGKFVRHLGDPVPFGAALHGKPGLPRV